MTDQDSSKEMVVVERQIDQPKAQCLRTRSTSVISMVKEKMSRKFNQFTMSSLLEKLSTLLRSSLIKLQNYFNVERPKRNAILTNLC